MTTLTTEKPGPRHSVADSQSIRTVIEACEPVNFVVLATHHVVFRIAWVFKTESVIMPAFMDHIAGAGWLRGCLPTLNRIGQSIPPLYATPMLRAAERKTPWLLATTLAMALPFLALAATLFVNGSVGLSWLPYAFLGFYALFSAATGLNQMCFGTIQGKLIRIERRGRLMAVVGLVGAVSSITCAWYLLRIWLSRPDGGFASIFAFTGCGFVVSGLVCCLLTEPAVAGAGPAEFRMRIFRRAWRTLRGDRHLTRLSLVGMLFVTSQLLFPHYQALGRADRAVEAVGRVSGEWNLTFLMSWVIAQNAGAGVFSVVAGALADRFGNRIAVRSMVFGAALTPLTALMLARSFDIEIYWFTFFLLGTVPTAFKVFTNYALELTGQHRHPEYIGTLKLCMAAPLLASPLVGWCVEHVGFTTVFTLIAALTACGGLLTFCIIEPRSGRVVE